MKRLEVSGAERLIYVVKRQTVNISFSLCLLRTVLQEHPVASKQESVSLEITCAVKQ